MSLGSRSGVHWMRRKLAVDRLGDDPRRGGLGQPGHALDQQVAAGEQADQHRLAEMLLPDHLRRERRRRPRPRCAALRPCRAGRAEIVLRSWVLPSVPVVDECGYPQPRSSRPAVDVLPCRRCRGHSRRFCDVMLGLLLPLLGFAFARFAERPQPGGDVGGRLRQPAQPPVGAARRAELRGRGVRGHRHVRRAHGSRAEHPDRPRRVRADARPSGTGVSWCWAWCWSRWRASRARHGPRRRSGR